MNSPTRTHHQAEVLTFLQQQVANRPWVLTLPKGSGNETYLACAGANALFIKLGINIPRYLALAAAGLTPAVIASGRLADGTPMIAQQFIPGRKPTRQDYRIHLDQFAATIDQLHHHRQVQQTLPATVSENFQQVGWAALHRLEERWKTYRPQVPQVAGFIDESLVYLAGQITQFSGAGLVAAHNDICNANWLLTPAGRLYLLDLDSMALDDPAVDIGATLWWYYPPALRPRFLEITGYPDDEQFQFRMWVRMAMHCLAITLPRPGSFDDFDPTGFAQALTDYRAVLARKENPQGYDEFVT